MAAMRTTGEPERSSELSLLWILMRGDHLGVLPRSFSGTDKELHVLEEG